jgi:two-component system nitrate/nitrite response regulator NarL
VTATPTRRGTRILIIDDHELFAESLELALSLEGYDVRRLNVVDGCQSPAQLLSAVARLHPRIVLLDLDLGRFGDGVGLIHPMAKAGANVVVVTASADRARWGECILYGARQAISKTRPLNEILSTVRRISQGLPVMRVEDREELLQLWKVQRQKLQEIHARLDTLTAREREVLGQLMEGHAVLDIAKLGVVSEATVRTQVKAILAKLQVSSQLAAVGLARQIEWQPPDADFRRPSRHPDRPGAA